MNGVSLNHLEVVSTEHGETKLSVTLTIMAENEFEAVGWLVQALNVDA